jgi:ubiquinone/menaquinone biosynthesis C-methylase UbiE
VTDADVRPAEIALNRALWAVMNERFTDAAAEDMWARPEVVWGLFAVRERDLGVPGDVRGLDVAELACGTAYFSAWLARAGASTVAVDLSGEQLATARRLQGRFGPVFPLVQADAERVPLASGCFDLVVSEHGAAAWCDPERWLPEVARLLRPGGQLVFLTNSHLSALCVPAEEG